MKQSLSDKLDIAGRGLTYLIIPTSSSWTEKGKLKRGYSASIGFKTWCIPNANYVTAELDFIEKILNNIVPSFLKVN
jgi:hypothetical protein